MIRLIYSGFLLTFLSIAVFFSAPSVYAEDICERTVRINQYYCTGTNDLACAVEGGECNNGSGSCSVIPHRHGGGLGIVSRGNSHGLSVPERSL